VQKKLDVLSNEMFMNALYNSNVCAVLVSEENDDPIIVPADIAGKFCVAFDPLDGSSNIDCNVSTGTIFGVWEKQPNSGPATEADILRPGREMVCAGYCAYGSATELVLTYGKGVQRFTLVRSFVCMRVCVCVCEMLASMSHPLPSTSRAAH